ncbi:hypothetical protein BH20ACT24_BH20ACT24_15230 [soil metagenome]
MTQILARLLREASRSKRRRRVAEPLLRLIAPALPRRSPPKGPVFVLGSPRSGTSVLFELLDRAAHLSSLGGESHLLWELYHPSSSPAWSSHRLGPESVTPRERRTLYWIIDVLAGGRRYLDKSPRNSLRVTYLAELFPDARFVFVKRDGRAAVSSLITGWRSDDPTFPGTPLRVPLRIGGYQGRNWKYVVPPGWEAYARGRSLPEVCAFQWVAANESILAGKPLITPERWIEVAYEQLVQAPREVAERILVDLEVPVDAEVLSFADELSRHVTRAVTAPRPDKWRDENPIEIERVLPAIAPTMRRLGYEPDGVR